MDRAHATVNSTYRRLQNSSAENAKRPQLIIATTSGVGRILESDILGIAAMNCNDRNVKGFVGYKYPTYACYGWLNASPRLQNSCVENVKRSQLILQRPQT